MPIVDASSYAIVAILSRVGTSCLGENFRCCPAADREYGPLLPEEALAPRRRRWTGTRCRNMKSCCRPVTWKKPTVMDRSSGHYGSSGQCLNCARPGHSLATNSSLINKNMLVGSYAVRQISHCKGGARRRRAAQRPRVLEASPNEAAKGQL